MNISLRKLSLIFCVGLSLLTAIVPFVRASYRAELNYNEGWNVYHAATLAHHGSLYPQKYGWTTDNYPMLSFALIAQLHRITGDFLFTGRAIALLSLIISCVLASAIVRRWTASRGPAILAGFLCLAIFCTVADAPAYVGSNEPQFLAHALVLGGLWCWVGMGRNRKAALCAALLFALGLSVKNNLLAAPLAVLIDALWNHWRRAIWFIAGCIIFGGLSLGLQVYYGGPHFLDELLLPRSYSVEKAIQQSYMVLGPLALLLAVGLYETYRLRRDRERRLAGLLLVASVAVGGFFAGGSGVSINSFFESFLAIAVLAGLWLQRYANPARAYAVLAPAALFAWLLIPWLIVPPLLTPSITPENWFPPLAMRHWAEKEERLNKEAELLREHPGPAVCESLLLCYYAGKSFAYDPFNATRLIDLGKLDANPMVSALEQKKYGVVQLGDLVEVMDTEHRDRFAPPIVSAIEANYKLVLKNEDGAFYLPLGGTPEHLTADAGAILRKDGQSSARAIFRGM